MVPPRRVKPTKTGWLFTALSGAIAIAALNTGNNIIYILLGLQFGIVAASGLWSEAVLRFLYADILPGPWVEAGKPAALRFRIEVKRKRWAAYLLQIFPDIRRSDDVPRSAGQRWKRSRWWTPLDRSGVKIVRSPWVRHVLPGDTFEGHLEMQFARRGIYGVRHVEIATLFPFGIIEKRRRNDSATEIVVAPERLESSEAGDTASASPEAEQTGRRLDPSGEFDGLRPFQPGDPVRLISWKTTARTGALTVKINRELLAPKVMVELEPFSGRPEELLNPVEQKRLDRQTALARTVVELMRESGHDVYLHDLPGARSGLSDAEARVLATWNGEKLPSSPASSSGEAVRIMRNGQVVRAG